MSSFIESISNSELSSTDILDALWLYTIIKTDINRNQNTKNTLPQETSNIKEPKKDINRNIKKSNKNKNIVENKTDTITIKLHPNINTSTNQPLLQKGEYFQTPTHKQLDKLNYIIKPLKILKQPIDSKTEYIFDEDKTIDYISNTNIFNISYKPKQELKYSLSLIIEESKSMEIYYELIKEFTNTLPNFNIFNKIEIFYLKESNGYIDLYKNNETKTSLSSIIKSNTNNITILITDFVSKYWGDRQGYNFLNKIVQKTPLMAIDMLPSRLWRRTQLFKTKIVNYKYYVGNLNKGLVSDLELSTDNKDIIKLPITTLEALSLKNWSKLIVSQKDSWSKGVIFEKNKYNIQNQNNGTQNRQSPQEIIDNFNKYASPLAKKLSIYLSTVPLSMDIMKIVQKENLSESNYTHIAEVFLSGLLIKSNIKTKRGDTIYEYKNGIQQILFKKLSLYKKIEILKNNSSFISNNIGSFLNFQALLENPTLKDGIPLSPNDKSFAKILVDVFKEMGGKYEKLANELKDKIDDKVKKDETQAIIPKSKRFKQGKVSIQEKVRNITIHYNFDISKYPVTFEEYDLFCEDTNRQKPDDSGWGRGKRPVIDVSWYDAKAYCEWLNKNLKINEKEYQYRLPSQLEWVYSCRAGKVLKWSFGNYEKQLTNYAWYDKNSNGKTHPVGEKLPNSWGLYDMHGNVWEWCEDDWVYVMNLSSTDGSAEVYPSHMRNYGQKIIRGGSWDSFDETTTTDIMDYPNINTANNKIGFRLIRTVPSDFGEFITDKKSFDIPKQLSKEKGITEIFGRKQELEMIEKVLEDNSILLLNGIGGIGKSTIANYYFYFASKEYKHYGLFNGIENFESELVKLFNIDVGVKEDSLNLVLSQLKSLNGKKLLVLDNIDEINNKIKKIMNLTKKGYKILITSRHITNIKKVKVLHINKLSQNSSIQFFKYNYKDKNISDIDIKKLVKYLHGNPLLIELATKRLKEGERIELMINKIKQYNKSTDIEQLKDILTLTTNFNNIG